MWVCTHECRYPWRSEVRHLTAATAGVTGGCGLQALMLGTELWFSRGVARITTEPSLQPSKVIFLTTKLNSQKDPLQKVDNKYL